MASEHWPLNTRKHDRLHGSMAPNLRSTSSLSSKTNRPKNTKTQGARSTHGGCPPQALKQTNMHQARKAAISAEKSAADHWSVSLIVFDQEHHTRQTLSLQQFSNHTGFPRDGKNDFLLCYFSPDDKNFAHETVRGLGPEKRTPKREFTQSQFDLLVSGRLGPVLAPFLDSKTGTVSSAKFVPREKLASFKFFQGYATKVLYRWLFHGFAGPRALVLHHTCS